MRTAKEIGALIRERRRAARMTQSELGRKAGASQRWISEIENGKSTAEIGMVLLTLAVLGIDLEARQTRSAAAGGEPPIDIDDILDAARR